MITVNSFAFTGYPVTDVPQARAFYEGLFNLKPASNFEHEGKHWIEYEVGDGTLAITNMSEAWKPSADGPAIAFEVDDFDATIAALRNHGSRFTIEPMDSGVCRMAVVIDPSGNSLCVHRRQSQ